MSAKAEKRAVGRKVGDLAGGLIAGAVFLFIAVSTTLWYIHDLEVFGLGVLHFFGIARNWVLPPGDNPWR
jgi:hypothetical protein